MWFGASNYACEFSCIPLAAEIFIPLLNDDDFKFLEEEELPPEYKPAYGFDRVIEFIVKY